MFSIDDTNLAVFLAGDWALPGRFELPARTIVQLVEELNECAPSAPFIRKMLTMSSKSSSTRGAQRLAVVRISPS